MSWPESEPYLERSTRAGRLSNEVPLLRGLLIAGAVLVSSWAVLAVVASRLPRGLLKDLAGIGPLTTSRLLGEPR